jgi:hypothetical protein
MKSRISAIARSGASGTTACPQLENPFELHQIGR